MGLFPPGASDDLDGYARATDHFLAAHRAAVPVLRVSGTFPVGLSTSDWAPRPPSVTPSR